MEPVTDPRLRQEVYRGRRVLLDLLSDLVHKYPKVIDLVAIVRTPYRLQELPMGQHLIGMSCEIAKKLELLRCEAHAASTRGDLASVEIDFDSAQRQSTARSVCPRSPAQGRPD